MSPFTRIAGISASFLIVGGVVAALAPPASASAASAQPANVPIVSFAQAAAAAALDPSGSPAGVNVNCSLSAAHPYPVVLVNGTFTVMQDSFGYLGPRLANAGYCVYGYNYGGNPALPVQAIGPVEDGVTALGTEVDKVLGQTGAGQVDLVGYSQGGLITELYTKFGGAAKVHSVTALSPTTHGTNVSGLFTLAKQIPGAFAVLGAGCPACTDQDTNSAVVAKLNDGPVAVAGIPYTVIESRIEDVVTPAGSSFIQEPGVHNVWLQDVNPFDTSEHIQLAFDSVTAGIVLNALSATD